MGKHLSECTGGANCQVHIANCEYRALLFYRDQRRRQTRTNSPKLGSRICSFRAATRGEKERKNWKTSKEKLALVVGVHRRADDQEWRQRSRNQRTTTVKKPSQK